LLLVKRGSPGRYAFPGGVGRDFGVGEGLGFGVWVF